MRTPPRVPRRERVSFSCRLLLLGSLCGTRTEQQPELGARADAELAVDVGEVALERPRGQRQFGCDLAVRVAARDEAGDARFRGRELLEMHERQRALRR